MGPTGLRLCIGTRDTTIRSGADLRGASPLVSFNHVIDPHFVAFSSSLYTTIYNPKPNPNRNRNPKRYTVINDPQIGP